jgi:hypothetical protein
MPTDGWTGELPVVSEQRPPSFSACPDDGIGYTQRAFFASSQFSVERETDGVHTQWCGRIPVGPRNRRFLQTICPQSAEVLEAD